MFFISDLLQERLIQAPWLVSILLVFMLSGLQEAPAQTEAEHIVHYNMSAMASWDLNNSATRHRYWDETHLVASLQGIVNRDAPRLYIRYNTTPDRFWWTEMVETGGWLADRIIDRPAALSTVLETFASYYKGAVVWDENVPATSNLASTLAGIEDLLCLRYDTSAGSLYTELVTNGTLVVKRSFVNPDGSSMFTGSGTIPGTSRTSTGSAKCDAYYWLIDNVIKTGLANPLKMGYYLDGYWLKIWTCAERQNHTLTNHDYVIAHKGIFFDLNVWDDETPVDDRSQKNGTDADTLRDLLRAAYDQFEGNGMIHVAGFVPWAYKYTNEGCANGSHGAVATEWKYAEILSCFNAFMDADALGYSAMANASFFQHYPLAEKISQNTKPTRASLRARGFIDSLGKVAAKHYVAHYVGDYDSAAWMYWMMPTLWTDSNRGSVPMSWAFNPNLAERFPLGMAWTRASRTDNDFFIAGDSGAGYLNPGLLSVPRTHSGLPSGWNAWENHCAKFFTQWDISLTGFVLDGNAPALTTEGLDAYARFSSDGIVAQKIAVSGVYNEMPYVRMGEDLPSDAAAAAVRINVNCQGTAPEFKVFRSILKSPSWYKQVDAEVAKLNGGIVMVDLYTLMELLKESKTPSNVENWPKY